MLLKYLLQVHTFFLCYVTALTTIFLIPSTTSSHPVPQARSQCHKLAASWKLCSQLDVEYRRGLPLLLSSTFILVWPGIYLDLIRFCLFFQQVKKAKRVTKHSLGIQHTLWILNLRSPVTQSGHISHCQKLVLTWRNHSYHRSPFGAV